MIKATTVHIRKTAANTAFTQSPTTPAPLGKDTLGDATRRERSPLGSTFCNRKPVGLRES